jgi:hypothetical protein
VADARQPIQRLAQEALIAGSARDRYLDQIGVVAGGKLCFDHFRQAGEQLAEPRQRFLAMAVERDLDDDRLGEAQSVLVQQRRVDRVGRASCRGSTLNA